MELGISLNMKPYEDLLIYNHIEVKRSRIKRVYLKWRQNNGIPYKCDINNCPMNTPDPKWNGKEVILIMDHTFGNKYDNRHDMLRLICPNCDSQLPTKGGKNKGRVLAIKQNYFIIKHTTVAPSQGLTYFGHVGIKLSGSAITSFKKGIP